MTDRIAQTRSAGSTGRSAPWARRGPVAAPTTHFPDPTAGMVLHRVLAMSARTFLLNDMGDELVDERQPGRHGRGPRRADRHPPLWAQSAASDRSTGTERRPTETERIHQSRVAMRRIRSNLRTFRLAPRPGVGHLAAGRAGLVRRPPGRVAGPPHPRATSITDKGPEVIDPDEVDQLDSVVDGAAWPRPWPRSPPSGAGPAASS